MWSRNALTLLRCTNADVPKQGVRQACRQSGTLQAPALSAFCAVLKEIRWNIDLLAVLVNQSLLIQRRFVCMMSPCLVGLCRDTTSLQETAHHHSLATPAPLVHSPTSCLRCCLQPKQHCHVLCRLSLTNTIAQSTKACEHCCRHLSKMMLQYAGSKDVAFELQPRLSYCISTFICCF